MKQNEPKLEIDEDGNKRWYLNCLLHREDGPAVEWASGIKCWYLNGQRHRKDGPAIEYADGNKFWWVNGVPLTEEEFNQKMNKQKKDIMPLVIEDLKKRTEKGIKEYGEPLKAHNGRDALWDAYEEALDLVQYLRQAIEERDGSTDYTKPPLGLMPKNIFYEKRLDDILGAISRHKEAGLPIPKKWYEEIIEMTKRQDES